jgi:putative spermidine/putrescine transport system permease protein
MRRSLQLLAGLALISWLVLPLVPLAIWSIAHGWRFPDLVPRDLTLKAWTYALSDTAGVTASLALTTGIALATTALAALIGIPAGRALGLYQFRGKAAVELFLLAPAIVPGIAVVFGLHGIFLSLGLAGTIPGVSSSPT